jgi:hypothetical protein
MKYEKLICISPEKNSNKTYEMQELGDGTFSATFSRVNVTPQVANYSMSKWNAKLQEKLKKGYVRVTEFVSEVKSTAATLTGEPTIDSLLMRLLQASQSSFSETYRVAATSVTKAQVDAVQRLINRITVMSRAEKPLSELHPLFVEIWTILPRTIKNVRDELPKNLDQVNRQLSLEQDAIDNANVQQAFVSTDERKNLLDNLGVTFSPKLSDIPDELVKFLGYDICRIKGIYRVSKPTIDTRFQEYVSKASDKTTALRYHGTKWKNGMAILQTGLRILGSKSSTYSGSMLGDAIYTSKDFEKSVNYSDGLMFVLNAHVGKTLIVKETADVKHYSYEMLRQMGYDSVNADPGLYTGRVTLQRHEQTIYNEAQHTFAYLLEWR